ncbi:MAG: molecular chaperone [Candidatus Binatia bacterium]
MKPENLRKEQEVREGDLALCRATLYSALALGFRPPTEETLTRLASTEGATVLAGAAALLDGQHQVTLTSAAEDLSKIKKTSVSELEVSFWRLFGHTVRGQVPLYETEYGVDSLFQQPQELADLLGFYHAFGLALDPKEHERADHVSCELEFLSFLALKEVYGLEQRDDPMLEETRKAARTFLRDHLGRFAPAFTRKLSREDREGFYGALGELCARFVIEDCTRLSVSVGPESLGLRPAAEDQVPMACDNGAECTELSGACEQEIMEK